MRKILIIKFSAIGDVVESLPVAAALKELYKDGCEITWITKKCHMCLLENNEFIDKIICFEDIKSTYFRLLKEIFRNYNKNFHTNQKFISSCIQKIFSKLPSIKILRGYRFDLVLDLQGSIESSVISMMCNAKYRLIPSFINNGVERFSTKINTDFISKQRVERYLDVVRFLGYSGNKINFGWNFSDEELMYVDEFLKEHGIIKGDRYIVMAIGTTWDTKNYPVVHWAKIVNYLYEKDICVVIIGGMNENKYIEELDKIISKDRYVNLVGLTDLRQMAIVISRSTVVVSGDSGPMHMAYSLGRFVIALMGPTDPVQFGPYGNKNKIIRVNHECRGCQLTVCPFGRDCLFDINPCDVIKELQIILESGGIRV